jgi:hypothetical protein
MIAIPSRFDYPNGSFAARLTKLASFPDKPYAYFAVVQRLGHSLVSRCTLQKV